jgi:hypothetical protein
MSQCLNPAFHEKFQSLTMPPVIGETVKPGGSNRRKIGRDLYRWIAIARGILSISLQKPGFCLFVTGAVAARLRFGLPTAKVAARH